MANMVTINLKDGSSYMHQEMVRKDEVFSCAYVQWHGDIYRYSPLEGSLRAPVYVLDRSPMQPGTRCYNLI